MRLSVVLDRDQAGDAFGAWEQAAGADDASSEADGFVVHEQDVGEDREDRAC
jgi:hypothetical protein